MTAQETGTVTGTKDKDYNLIWYVEACLGNALRLETYIQDADREGDSAVPGHTPQPVRNEGLLRTGWVLDSVAVHGHPGERHRGRVPWLQATGLA
jgi:hypothetical protein